MKPNAPSSEVSLLITVFEGLHLKTIKYNVVLWIDSGFRRFNTVLKFVLGWGYTGACIILKAGQCEGKDHAVQLAVQ